MKVVVGGVVAAAAVDAAVEELVGRYSVSEDVVAESSSVTHSVWGKDADVDVADSAVE